MTTRTSKTKLDRSGEPGKSKPGPLKVFMFAVCAMLFGTVMTLIAAEIVMRFLPYNQALRTQPVNEENPIFHFQPNRVALWSQDWDFKLQNTVRINNAGYVNGQDYDAAARSPLLAVIGDSYIEAAIVPYEQTVQGRLAKAVGKQGRVYSFAAAGAGLPQYLVWARHARDTYKPDLVLFNIISNDFGESLHFLEHSPGFWRFDKREDGTVEWKLTRYEPSLPRRIARRSALAMYLFLNAKIQTVFNKNIFSISNLGKNDRRWVANTDAHTPEEKLAHYRWAVDRFLDFAPEYSGLPVDRILLAFDGFRPHMYKGAEDMKFARGSTWARMRSYMMEQARAKGMTVIDLDPVFRDRFARDGKRFEHPTDSHWSGVGHGTLAEAVAKALAFRQVFGNVSVAMSAN